MGFTIPNESDAAFPEQAEPDSIDLAIIAAGLAGYGVVSGCAVTAQGTPDMTVAVAAGVITASGTTGPVTAGNVTIATADATNPRIDLIVTTGTNAVIAGTPAANPVLPASYVAATHGAALAAVYVPANDTAIGSTQIIDKRVILPDPTPVADDPVADAFGTPDTAFEFATSSLTGLTAVGTPATENADTTFPGCLYLYDNVSGDDWGGRYVAKTAASPFTVITYLRHDSVHADYNAAGLFVGEATPGKMSVLMVSSANRKLQGVKYSSPTAYSADWGSQYPYTQARYLAIVVNSDTDVDLYASIDGYLWWKHADAADPSLTIGSVGLAYSNNNGSSGSGAAFEYLRIWDSALTFPGA